MKMTKTFIMAMALLAGVATTADAKKKDKEVKAPVKALVSGSDSLSYAGAYAQTEGLIPFLKQKHEVDSAQMADFVKYLREEKENYNAPNANVLRAARDVVNLIEERMIKGVGQELEGSGYAIDRDLFYEGFIAAIQNDTTRFNMADAQKTFMSTLDAIKKAKDDKLKAEGQAWLAENATKPGVVTLPSGLQYKVIEEGNGPKPVATDEVSVKYEGHLIDGTEFDSSYKRKDPVTKFRANQVIKGWTEALTNMSVGSKWEVYVPQELGYGARANGRIPAYSTLIFTVELVGITEPEAPKEEVAADPAAEAKAKAEAAAEKEAAIKRVKARKGKK